ncbi:MAG: hypothetical protein HKL90_16185 [Elusimicrobia bacterium]|nr:hypothetical protein [Elusimicrobiota bacterium]
MRGSLSIAVPTWKDARVWLALVFVLFCYRALSFAGFGRTRSQLLVCVAVGGVLDVIFNRLKYDRWIFPISGILASIGPFLMVDSISIRYYALIVFLSIGSKFFFRWNGRHIFNPNNFGILVAAIGLSGGVAPNPSRWAGSFEWTLIIFVLGAWLSWMAERWAASIAYYWVFFLGCLVRSAVQGVSIWFYWGTMLGPMFQLICFFMITDPKTSPNNRKLQLLFGGCVALLDNLFRFYELRLSVYLALFVTTVLYAVVDHFTGDSKGPDPWREKELEFGVHA